MIPNQITQSRNTLRVGGIQLGPYQGSYEAQMQHLIRGSEELLRSDKFDVFCLPEMMTSPYMCTVEREELKSFAEPIPGPSSTRIAELARKYSTFIIGTAYEYDEKDRKYYNSAFICSDTGDIIGKYRKTHIPYIKVPGTMCLEKFYFDPGKELKTFEIKGVKVGLLICYDRSFPEAWRVLALQGAKVIIVPASSSGFRSEAFVDELRIRALENGVYAFAVNKYGDETMEVESDTIHFYGKSCVIDPFGQVQLLLKDESNLSIAYDFDLNRVDEARSRLTYLKDRRPDLYKQLTE
jgi:beta-ureidopropionase